MGPKAPMTSIMRRGDTDAEGKSHLKMDTETRFMLPAAQGLPGDTGSWKRQGRVLSCCF